MVHAHPELSQEVFNAARLRLECLGLREVKENWERLGEADPFYAILSDPNKKGGKWNVKEFFDSGIREVGDILSRADVSNLTSRRQRAMDFGCGVGRLTQPLAARFKEVVGVDIASSMVKLAEEFNRSPNCKFIVNSKSDLSLFPDNYFDFVLSLLTLQHMSPKVAKGYLREFLRVLSNGGVAYFGIPEGLIESGMKVRIAVWLKSHPRAMSLYTTLRLQSGPVTEMHGIKRTEVVSLIQSAGGSV